jgi:hypothetical protein
MQASQRSRRAPRAVRYDACSVHCAALRTSGLRLTAYLDRRSRRSKELPAGSRSGGSAVDALTWNALPEAVPCQPLSKGRPAMSFALCKRF